MARASNERKRRDWVKRFERFRASGATVAQFCGNERVSVNSFYYWSKRVGPVAAPEHRHASSEAPRAAAIADRAAARRDDARALVRFRFGGMEVEVPADCLDVIRCLAQSAGRPAEQFVRSTPGAFHEIVLSAQR